LSRAECASCGNWERQAIDFGHCWSGDRLDGDLTKRPADTTYPDAVCEAWWGGTFDPDMIRRPRAAGIPVLEIGKGGEDDAV
jgi:hypothetical protein